MTREWDHGGTRGAPFPTGATPPAQDLRGLEAVGSVIHLSGYSRWDDPDVTNTGVGDPAYADMGAYERQGE